MKKLNLYTYARLHEAFQNAKVLKGDYVDVDILKLVDEKEKIEQKYNENPIDRWDIGDIERISCIILQITYYMKGLNVAESILQKIAKPNGV